MIAEMRHPVHVVDLFCGGGGASVGMQQAGANSIIGVASQISKNIHTGFSRLISKSYQYHGCPVLILHGQAHHVKPIPMQHTDGGMLVGNILIWSM